MQLLAGNLNRGLGPGKDKMVSAMTIDGVLVFRAVAGRARAIRKSLKRVLAVGRDIGVGYGRVASWEVTPVDDMPVRHAVVEGGVALRNLPPSWCSSSERVVSGMTTPPYWTHQEPVVPTGARVELRPEVAYQIDRMAEVPPRPRNCDQ